MQEHWQSERYKDYWKRFDLDVVPYDGCISSGVTNWRSRAERGDADAIETLMLIEMRDPDPAERQRDTDLMARLRAAAPR